MADFIRLASILEESIADGPGLRFVVFAQGCPHRCRGCHNPQTFLSVGGQDFSIRQVVELYGKNPLIRGITLSGGEPFLQAAPLALLAGAVHDMGGDIVTYSGYRLEQLLDMADRTEGIRALLTETDLLIDGPFVLARRSLEHPFVGSLNQRLISLSEKGDRLLEDIVMPEDVPPVERIHYGGGRKKV
ncbi:MAG: 4Fe-4S cluster-binding domain-containing protein [Clostridiaceae bacterium]|nr:4Fe-4S cluster-binding domain-containing protein [Clostridiaceae bacterium]